MTENVYFEIANHILLVKVPRGFPLMNYLPSFTDFTIKESDLTRKPIVEVVVSLETMTLSDDNVVVLANDSPVWGEDFRFEEFTDHYLTSMKSSDSNSTVVMLSSKDFSFSTVYLGSSDGSQRKIICWFLMVAFGQSILNHNTVLIHASTVELNHETAYAFLGKSGTGKSTHSQLWLKYFPSFTLLNDDNPVVRIFDNNEVYIYGSPWSGKTDCYRNLKVELKGLVRLKQADVNCFQIKKDSDALIMLLPSCTGIRWNRKLFNKMVDTIQAIVRVVPVGYLECLIDEEAANMSYNGIKLIK